MPARTSGSNKGCVQKRRTGEARRCDSGVHVSISGRTGECRITHVEGRFYDLSRLCLALCSRQFCLMVVLSGRESAVRVARTLARTTPRTLKVQRTSSRVTGPGEHNLNSYLSMHGHGGMSSNGARLLWLYQRSGASSSVTVLEYWCRKSP